MQQQIIRGRDNGNVYTISFFLNFGWMLLGPILFMVPFMVLYMAENGGDINVINEERFILGSFVTQLISYVLPIGLAIVIFRKGLKKDLKNFFKKWWLSLSYIIGGVVAIIFISGMLTLIYQELGITGDASNQAIIEQALNSPLRYVVFLMVVFGAPIYEELIFRKFLVGFCEEKLKLNRWIAFLISAVLFALIHVISDPASYIFFFQYFGLSVIITLSYTLSNNNIFVPMGIHFIQNLMSFLLI